MKLLAACALLAGCAQVLGLENTKFDQRDGSVDAPSVCDGAPSCTASSGRSMCGQLIQTGTNGGAPLRVASPTGQTCAMLNSSEGPCAMTIFGQALASYYAQNATDRIAGEIDDCGRFVVPDIDAAAKDVVAVLAGSDAEQTAAVVLGRDTTVGTDRNVALPVVTTGTAAAWGMQISPGTPADVTGSYLVTYVNAMGQPLEGYALRVNGAAVGDAPTLPWGVYFSGAQRYGTSDPTLEATQDSGSALVVPAGGTFQLGGVKPGDNCAPVSLQAVSGALIHVTLSC